MRGLAKFVMTGRKQAFLAVVLLGLVPIVNFLNPVIVGLIMLRKGTQEAVYVLAWAILPIGGWAIAGDPLPLIMLIGISGLSYLLRVTESWEFTLVAAIVIGVCVEIYLRIQPAVLDVVFLQFDAMLTTSNIEGIQPEQYRELLTSLIGAVYMFLAIVLLMLARWMQAALYNPGGFQKEFHGLRIERKVAMLLLGLMLLANFGVLVPESWVLYLILPLMFSGLALIHAVVARKKLSTMWLTALYAFLLLPVVAQLLVLLALVDSWYNFRARLKSSV